MILPCQKLCKIFVKNFIHQYVRISRRIWLWLYLILYIIIRIFKKKRNRIVFISVSTLFVFMCLLFLRVVCGLFAKTVIYILNTECAWMLGVCACLVLQLKWTFYHSSHYCCQYNKCSELKHFVVRWVICLSGGNICGISGTKQWHFMTVESAVYVLNVLYFTQLYWLLSNSSVNAWKPELHSQHYQTFYSQAWSIHVIGKLWCDLVNLILIWWYHDQMSCSKLLSIINQSRKEGRMWSFLLDKASKKFTLHSFHHKSIALQTMNAFQTLLCPATNKIL